MQLTDMAYRIGRLESGLKGLQARSDDRWGLVMMHLRKNGNGNGSSRGHKLPWIQIAAYGAAGVLSLLGITLPEKVAALLKALMH